MDGVKGLGLVDLSSRQSLALGEDFFKGNGPCLLSISLTFHSVSESDVIFSAFTFTTVSLSEQSNRVDFYEAQHTSLSSA